MSSRPACIASFALVLWSATALHACSVDRTPQARQGQRDPLRQAKATATLSALGAASSAIIGSATVIETSESVDLSVRIRSCSGAGSYAVRILEARSCDGLAEDSASFRDEASDAIPRLWCTAASGGEGRLRYARPVSAAARWSVGDGSQADVVGRAIAIFDPATLEPIACGVLEPSEDRVLMAQPALDQPPSARARAAVAGVCALQGDEPAACVDVTALAACATEHCELGACLAQCGDYATCADAASDACLAPTVCARSDACAACQEQLVSCSRAFCAAHVTCASVPATGGPCSSLLGCCILQGDRAATCAQSLAIATAMGEPSCSDELSDWEALAHHAVPCDASTALEEALALPPGSEPTIELEGRSCWTATDCDEDEQCLGAVDSVELATPGRCRAFEATPRLEDGVAGSACASSAECDRGSCAVFTPLRTPYPGGYCTARCYEDEACGAGGVCVLLRGSSEPGHCFQRCEGDGACARDHYRCTPLGDGTRVVGACYPRSEALPDGVTGSPCQSAADCRGAAAECRQAIELGFLEGEAVPAPGGHCTAPCMFDIDCGEGAQCIASGLGGGLCMARCDAAAPCRDGYECYAHLRDGDAGAKVCVPKQP